MSKFILSLLCFISACSTFPMSNVVVSDLQPEEMYQSCKSFPSARFTNRVILGCFKVEGDVCHIYISKELDATNATLEHELRHCREGYFHGRNPF